MRLPLFRSEDKRSASERLARLGVQTMALVRLPTAVRTFYVRALWVAWRTRDQYSFDVVTRPRDLRAILALAQDADHVIELGTATAWTAIALGVERAARTVTTYDPVYREQRERYLRLVPSQVRDRIHFVQAPGRTGPSSDQPVDFVFIDGSHDRSDTIMTFEVWRPSIQPGGRVVFHDYMDSSNPGVTEAVQALAITGAKVERMFVWTASV
jgi:predicted O-methyltransferase YrrM